MVRAPDTLPVVGPQALHERAPAPTPPTKPLPVDVGPGGLPWGVFRNLPSKVRSRIVKEESRRAALERAGRADKAALVRARWKAPTTAWLAYKAAKRPLGNSATFVTPPLPTPTGERFRQPFVSHLEAVAVDQETGEIPHARAQSSSRVLRDRARAFALAPRVGMCGARVPSRDGAVALKNVGGKLRASGTVVCRSPWSCPVCAVTHAVIRTDQILTACAHVRERGGTVGLLSLTVRHQQTDDARVVVAAVADAWRGFIRGEPWKRAQRHFGIHGVVRAAEDTLGRNGQHAHLHVLVSFAGAVDVERFRLWASQRWRTMVERHGSERFVPDDVHGCHFAESTAESYIAKLGLETGGVGKSGPFATLSEALDGNRRARAMWLDYQRARRGKRRITYSRAMGPLMHRSKPLPEAQPLAVLPRDVWHVVRKQLWVAEGFADLPTLCDWIAPRAGIWAAIGVAAASHMCHADSS